MSHKHRLLENLAAFTMFLPVIVQRVVGLTTLLRWYSWPITTTEPAGKNWRHDIEIFSWILSTKGRMLRCNLHYRMPCTKYSLISELIFIKDWLITEGAFLNQGRYNKNCTFETRQYRADCRDERYARISEAAYSGSAVSSHSQVRPQCVQLVGGGTSVMRVLFMKIWFSHNPAKNKNKNNNNNNLETATEPKNCGDELEREHFFF